MNVQGITRASVLTLVAIWALIGCATTDMWYLHGKSEAQLSAAHQECELYSGQYYQTQALSDAAYSTGYSGSAGAMGALVGLFALNQSMVRDAYNRCMEHYGFTRAN